MNLKYLLFLSICLTGMSCSTQIKGYIVTNANDTIKGKFKLTTLLVLPADSAHTSVFTVYTTKGKRIDIKLRNIRNIDIVKRKKVVATYIISGNDFWHLLVAKGDLGIYVRNYKAITESEGVYYNYTEDFYDYGKVPYKSKYLDIAILSGKIQKAQIYNDLQNVDDIYIGKKVLQFVNLRYGLNLTFKELHIDQRTDFVNQKKLFDFILEKEAELEQHEKH